jgi:hypothetical protein
VATELSNFLIKELDAVLIHIPKTGGTSIRKGVFKEVIGPEYGNFPSEWSSLFKFAFVREPVERFLSCVAMFRYGTTDEGGVPRRSGNTKLSLEYAIEILSMHELDYGENRQSVEERFLHHALPMTHRFNMLDHANYVGRYENLGRDYLEICQLCGLSTAPELPKLHRSRVPISIEELRPSQLERLIEYYGEDYRFTGYDIPQV